MKASAKAHPIQGLVKYHGFRDPDLRIPLHDSISLCTAPAHTRTTVEFGVDEDSCVVDGEPLEGGELDRVERVLDRVRELSSVDSGARVESTNSFPSNVGLGASSSAFAALALAACQAADLDMSLEEVSSVARRGASSAARSVTGGFSQLRASDRDGDCSSRRLDDGFDDLRVVVALVPAYKQTAHAHEEAGDSHMLDSRLAHVHGAVAEMRAAVLEGDFEGAFELAERDSLSLLATTMTGPSGWVYWRPETLEVLETARELRDDDVPVYFSSDTGATAYLNTRERHVDRVAEAVEDLGLETMEWRVGGPAEPEGDHLF